MTNMTKMAMMRRAMEPEIRRDSRGRYAPRNEYNGGRVEMPAGMENAYGGYSPERQNDEWRIQHLPSSYDDRTTSVGGMDVDNRFRDRRGREHYNNGRYAPMRNAMDDYETRNAYDQDVPPIHENNGTGYRYEDGSRMIGFSSGKMRMGHESHHVDELELRRNQMSGGSKGHARPMDRQLAQEWVRGMKHADGSSGEHWTYDQTTQVMKQRNIDCEPAEFYAIMNAMWSDYGKVAEKFGVDNIDFWAELSKAWLMDKDSMQDKAALYYDCIVKK